MRMVENTGKLIFLTSIQIDTIFKDLYGVMESNRWDATEY